MRHRLSDVACQQIADELEQYGLVVKNILNYDHALIFYFGTIILPSGPFVTTIVGELRIDRIDKYFEIIATCGEYLIFPVKGQWEDVGRFLEQLVSSEASEAQFHLMPAQPGP